MSDWYSLSRTAIQREYGDDWKLFSALLAATSANSQIKSNVTLARKAYNEIKADGNVNCNHFTGSHYSQIQKVLTVGHPTSQKVGAFYQALIGDEEAVVIDIWMVRHYRHSESPLSAKQYKALASQLTAEAKEAGMSPARYQAKTWEAIRGNRQSYADCMNQMRLF